MQPVDLRQVDPGQTKELAAYVKVGGVLAVAVDLGIRPERRVRVIRIEARFEDPVLLLDLVVTLSQLVRVGVIQRQGLLEREHMLGPIVAGQGLSNVGFAPLTATMAQLGQLGRIALTGHDRSDDGQAGHPADVAQHLSELDIHLLQGFLHMLNMGGPVFNEHGPLTQVAAQHHDLGFWPEGGTQQPITVQALDPLAILHIALAPRHVLDVAGVDQIDLQTALFQQLEDRDPVHPGRFHRRRRHPASYQPGGQRLQVGGKGPEAPDRVRVPVGWHTRPNLAGTNIQPGGMRVDDTPNFIRGGRLLRHSRQSPICAPTWSSSEIVCCSSGSAPTATRKGITLDQNQTQ